MLASLFLTVLSSHYCSRTSSWAQACMRMPTKKCFSACSIRHLAPAHCSKHPQYLGLDSSSVRHRLRETFLQIFRHFYHSNLHSLPPSLPPQPLCTHPHKTIDLSPACSFTGYHLCSFVAVFFTFFFFFLIYICIYILHPAPLTLM